MNMNIELVSIEFGSMFEEQGSETPKAPWDWKVLEPSLDVACPFPLLGS